jgi:bifunctional DNA-binding transcriptional regulator/antitoxin component of YhaV-PrlF toxin-antitoxin module
MASWRAKVNAAKRPAATRVSRNGQIVLSAPARRAAGIAAGDLVVSLPVAPGVVLVEKVRAAGEPGLKEQYEQAADLRGLWGDDPDAWLDELRGQWLDRPVS